MAAADDAGKQWRVMITGAYGGIGQALVLRLAENAIPLWLVGRRREKLDDVMSRLSPDQRTRITVAVHDIADADDRARLRRSIEQLPWEARPNVLINLAGINDVAWFESQATGVVERLVSVNLAATMLVTQALLPALRETGRARVINVGSMLGHIGHPGYAAYCAAKFGLRGFSEALRREYAGTSVRVQYLAPRATRTPMNAANVQAMNQALGNAIDDPDDVAQAVLELLGSGRKQRLMGHPERVFAILNNWCPALIDRALGRKVSVMQRYLGGAGVEVVEKGVAALPEASAEVSEAGK